MGIVLMQTVVECKTRVLARLGSKTIFFYAPIHKIWFDVFIMAPLIMYKYVKPYFEMMQEVRECWGVFTRPLPKGWPL